MPSLHIDQEVRESLAALLQVIVEMPSDADVVDHLPNDPWGDLERFADQVYRPLVDGRRSDAPGPIQVELSELEWVATAHAIDAISHSFSEGVPFLDLDRDYRRVVAEVLRKVRGA